ncbi:hypothetical protein NQ317_009635 [Molorchus minor]|uniref:Meiosis-specific with OB domain-containing protein n=1 Tax=Molorchus minor TaxID=1323400 RepID=A0ABQ9IUX7_9CUCU|nr:hypothetical protein NQ317_009635 [Molorchus minor]
MDNIALQKVNIRNLDPNLENVLIVGIIIAKQRPKKFLDTKVSAETYRAVWNFTLRDSVQDYINVTYWSSSEVVFQTNDKFNSGDVVEVINPKILVRKINDYGEQFRPMVTSPFYLSLTEQSAIIKHYGDVTHYLRLLRFPTKPIAGFLPLRDIHNSGAAIKGTYVDILAIVRGLGPNRTVTTKNNENLQVRTIELFDHTSPSLKVDIWEPDVISRSNSWKPRYTALFLTDLCIHWSNFERSFMARVTGRTVVTENPEGTNTIQEVMSIKQVQDKINYLQGNDNMSGTKQFTALIFAFVSSLDLDGLSKTLLIKCGHCKMPMKGSNCENAECPTVFEGMVVESDMNFDIRIMLTDHTGTLTRCRFGSQAAEQALNCTPREFSNMSDDDKCKLKWKYLMERCAVRIAVLFIGKQLPIITVLCISLADTFEVARRLPVY